MTDIDRATERRNAWVQFGVLAAGATVLAWLIIDDHRLLLALLPVLVLVLGHRSWMVERFSPTLAESYARAVVSRSGDAMVHVLRTDRSLGGLWIAGGTDVRVTGLSPDDLGRAMAALRRERFPARPLPGLFGPVNRLVAVLLGGAAGLGVAATFCRVPGGMPSALWLGAAAVVASRVFVTVHNRRQLTAIADYMRRHAPGEMDALLSPPFTGRRRAVVAELNRLTEYAAGTAVRWPIGELTVIGGLTFAGAVAGLAAGLTWWPC